MGSDPNRPRRVGTGSSVLALIEIVSERAFGFDLRETMKQRLGWIGVRPHSIRALTSIPIGV